MQCTIGVPLLSPSHPPSAPTHPPSAPPPAPLPSSSSRELLEAIAQYEQQQFSSSAATQAVHKATLKPLEMSGGEKLLQMVSKRGGGQCGRGREGGEATRWCECELIKKGRTFSEERKKQKCDHFLLKIHLIVRQTSQFSPACVPNCRKSLGWRKKTNN